MRKMRIRVDRRPASGHLLRNLLVQRRQELLRGLHDELASTAAAGIDYGDIADQASASLYNELAHGFAEIASADIRMIDQAIQRIDDQTYGLCESCGQPIPQARLRALPFASLCVRCKREEEAGESQRLAAVALLQ